MFINKTRFILESEATTFESWARRAIRTRGAGLKGDKKIAYTAVFSKDRFFPPRDEDEAVAWLHRAYDACKEQALVCLSEACPVSAGHCSHLAAHACAPVAHSLSETECWKTRQAEVLGCIHRYTKVRGKHALEIARWLTAYLKMPSNAGVRNWLHPKRIGDLVLIAKVWRRVNVPWTIPARDLLKVSKMKAPYFLADLCGRYREYTAYKGVHDSQKFWEVISRLLKEGGKKCLRIAPLGAQIAGIVPGGYDPAVHAVIKAHIRHRLYQATGAHWGHDPNDQSQAAVYAWELLRSVKWSAYRKLTEQGIPAELALRAVSVFGNNAQLWIERMSEGEEWKVHDCTEFLPLGTRAETEGLGDWLWAHRSKVWAGALFHEDRKCLKAVCYSWARLTPQQRLLPWKDLVAATKIADYGFVPEEAVPFATECAKWEMPERLFQADLELFLESQEVPHVFAQLQGKEWMSPDGALKGYFLDRSDMRGMWLGQYTDCCQHLLHSMGGQCARFGQSSPNSGFFVWENSRGIQAQAWVWRTDTGACFDNIESLRTDEKMKNNILRILRDAAASVLEVSGSSSVSLGTGLDSEGFHEAFPKLENPLNPAEIGYPSDGYRDSHNQVLILRSEP